MENEITVQERNANAVSEIKDSIIVGDNRSLTNFGRGVEESLSQFTSEFLSKIQASDFNEVKETLSELISNIESSKNAEDEKKKSFFSNLFSKSINKTEKMVTEIFEKSSSIEEMIRNVTKKLEMMRDDLENSIDLYENYKEKNSDYSNQLEIHKAALDGKIKETQKIVDDLIAKDSDNFEAINKIKDLRSFLTRMDRKLEALLLAKSLSNQNIMEIQMIQGNHYSLIQSIDMSLVHTIPTWKNQLVNTVNLINQRVASEVNDYVTTATNDIIKRNSEIMKSNSTKIARQLDAAPIDVKALEQINTDIVDVIKDVIQIQNDGDRRRKDTQSLLENMEKKFIKSIAEVTKEGNTPLLES
ncbi:toxic anion resistance protein [Candidatus Pacearchaeota archaeon]|nr:toxic anion resistance protein [Candidatus Pacearchaeota archaeon]